MTIYDLLTRLDDSSFLGLGLWEFSFRSLRRRYGLTFLSRIAFRHPLKTLTGILRYRRLLRERRERGDITPLFAGSGVDFISRLGAGKRDLLVAVGFCQKPLDPACPAGRPNHDCLYFDELDLRTGREFMDPACHQCKIREIGARALRAGANMHIMTSALDIAHDVMIPSIDHERFRKAIMCLCPYSVQAIALPLMICGIEGFLIGYASGNCMDYEQWLLADKGIKREMTFLSPTAYDRVLSLLEVAADRRENEGSYLSRFLREGNIYAPSE
jgi:hypothetical protein